MKNPQITVRNNNVDLHHMPQHETRMLRDTHGMTLRQILKALRSLDFGDIGGSNCIYLTDDSCLVVKNIPCDSGYLIGQHEVVRYSGDWANIVARYKL